MLGSLRNLALSVQSGLPLISTNCIWRDEKRPLRHRFRTASAARTTTEPATESAFGGGTRLRLQILRRCAPTPPPGPGTVVCPGVPGHGPAIAHEACPPLRTRSGREGWSNARTFQRAEHRDRRGVDSVEVRVL